MSSQARHVSNGHNSSERHRRKFNHKVGVASIANNEKVNIVGEGQDCLVGSGDTCSCDDTSWEEGCVSDCH